MSLLLAKIVYEPIVPPSENGVDLGPGFDSWFLISCARNPADRWQSAGLQVEALATALGFPEEALLAPTPSASPFLQSYDDGALSEPSDLRAHSLDGSITAASVQQFQRPGFFGLAIAFGLALAAVALLIHRDSSVARNQYAHEEPPPMALPTATPETNSSEPRADATNPMTVGGAPAAIPPAPEFSPVKNSRTDQSHLPIGRPSHKEVHPRRVVPRSQDAPPTDGASSSYPPRDPLADPD